jgi:hypothetical protein
MHRMKSRSKAILLSGIGIGWIVGLSLSPAVHILVASIIALAAAAAGTAAGIAEIKGKKFEFNPAFVAVLILGLALGAPLGIFARTNSFFGPSAKFLAWRWPSAGTTNASVDRLLFDQLISQTAPEKGSGAHTKDLPPAPRGAGLFATQSASTQIKLLPLHGQELKDALINTYGDAFRTFIESMTVEQLETLKGLLCR